MDKSVGWSIDMDDTVFLVYWLQEWSTSIIKWLNSEILTLEITLKGIVEGAFGNALYYAFFGFFGLFLYIWTSLAFKIKAFFARDRFIKKMWSFLSTPTLVLVGLVEREEEGGEDKHDFTRPNENAVRKKDGSQEFTQPYGLALPYGDVEAFSRLVSISFKVAGDDRQLILRSGTSYLSLARDLKSYNIIVIGGTRYNPAFKYLALRLGLKNIRENGNELSVRDIDRNQANGVAFYGVSPFNHSKRVVIVAGVREYGTSAAMYYLTENKSAKMILRKGVMLGFLKRRINFLISIVNFFKTIEIEKFKPENVELIVYGEVVNIDAIHNRPLRSVVNVELHPDRSLISHSETLWKSINFSERGE